MRPGSSGLVHGHAQRSARYDRGADGNDRARIHKATLQSKRLAQPLSSVSLQLTLNLSVKMPACSNGAAPTQATANPRAPADLRHRLPVTALPPDGKRSSRGEAVPATCPMGRSRGVLRGYSRTGGQEHPSAASLVSTISALIPKLIVRPGPFPGTLCRHLVACHEHGTTLKGFLPRARRQATVIWREATRTAEIVTAGHGQFRVYQPRLRGPKI